MTKKFLYCLLTISFLGSTIACNQSLTPPAGPADSRITASDLDNGYPSTATPSATGTLTPNVQSTLGPVESEGNSPTAEEIAAVNEKYFGGTPTPAAYIAAVGGCNFILSGGAGGVGNMAGDDCFDAFILFSTGGYEPLAGVCFGASGPIPFQAYSDDVLLVEAWDRGGSGCGWTPFWLTNIETGVSIQLDPGFFCNPFNPSSPCYPDQFPTAELCGVDGNAKKIFNAPIGGVMIAGTPVCGLFRTTQTPSVSPTVTPTHSPTTTPTFTPTRCSNYEVEITPYQQQDGRWRNNNLDHSRDTIGNSGCFLTCFSMADGRTPDEMNDLLTKNEDIDSEGNITQARVAETLAWEKNEIIDFSDQALLDTLNSGEWDVVIVAVKTRRKHFVLVTGATSSNGGCRFVIQDPGPAERDFLDQYPGRKLSIRRFSR